MLCRLQFFPIFAKPALQVESQQIWLTDVFGGNPKHFVFISTKLEEGLLFSIAAIEKNIFNVIYLENDERYDVDSIKVNKRALMGF